MENEKIVKKICMVLFAVILSIAGAMIWVSNGYKEGGLLQRGEVYDFPEKELEMGMGSCTYDKENQVYVTQQENAVLDFNVVSDVTLWRYCTIYLKDLSISPQNWTVAFLDVSGEVLHEQLHVMRKGKNNLHTPMSNRVAVVKITIHQPPGTSFAIEGFKLRQAYFDIDDFMQKAVVLFLLCIVVYILAMAVKQLDWYFIVELLQNFFIWIGDAWGSRLSVVMSTKLRKRFQIICFAVSFLLMVVMNVGNGSGNTLWVYYCMLALGIVLVFAGVLSWRKPLQKLNWRNGICFSWLLLWGITAISDLFVAKGTPFIGYIMVFCMGFAFFVWNNEKEFQEVMYLMMKGLQLTLVPILLYCLVFRQKKPGILYNGCFRNHESMSIYALALLIVFLAEMNLLNRQKKFYIRRCFFSGMGASFSCFLLYYSDTYSCNIMAIVVLGLWLVSLMKEYQNLKKFLLKVVLTGIITIVCSLVLILGVKYGIQTLPEKLGTNMFYSNEVQETRLPEELMYAFETENPGWIEGVVPAEGIQRKQIWWNYIQKLNLTGNSDKLLLEEAYLGSFNGMIQMAYRYGIFVLVPYIMLLLLVIYSAIRNRKFLWFVTVLAFVFVSMFENLEFPFTQPLWLMFYMEVGRMFGNKIENKRLGSTHEGNV